MTYQRGARVRWSFTEEIDDGYEQDFETMVEAEAFAHDRQQEARQQGAPCTVEVFDLDGLARLFEAGMKAGIIFDRRRE